jgi:hypothetical protein
MSVMDKVADEPLEPLLPPSRAPRASIGAGGPLQDALPSVGQLRTYASSALHAVSREKVHYCLGCFSCLLVVVISAVLITLIHNTPGSSEWQLPHFATAASVYSQLCSDLRTVIGAREWRDRHRDLSDAAASLDELDPRRARLPKQKSDLQEHTAHRNLC